jgi:hypothetical protein
LLLNRTYIICIILLIRSHVLILNFACVCFSFLTLRAQIYFICSTLLGKLQFHFGKIYYLYMILHSIDDDCESSNEKRCKTDTLCKIRSSQELARRHPFYFKNFDLSEVNFSAVYNKATHHKISYGKNFLTGLRHITCFFFVNSCITTNLSNCNSSGTLSSESVTKKGKVKKTIHKKLFLSSLSQAFKGTTGPENIKNQFFLGQECTRYLKWLRGLQFNFLKKTYTPKEKIDLFFLRNNLKTPAIEINKLNLFLNLVQPPVNCNFYQTGCNIYNIFPIHHTKKLSETYHNLMYQVSLLHQPQEKRDRGLRSEGLPKTDYVSRAQIPVFDNKGNEKSLLTENLKHSIVALEIDIIFKGMFMSQRILSVIQMMSNCHLD